MSLSVHTELTHLKHKNPFTQQPFRRSPDHLAGSAGPDGSPPLPVGHTNISAGSVPVRPVRPVRPLTSRMWCSRVILDLLALVSVSLSKVLILNPSAFPVWVP